MNEENIVRDERTVAVENASYRFAYKLLGGGLLLDAFCRAWAQQRPYWDLMALVVISGGAATAYQAARGTLFRYWARFGAAVLFAGALSAVIIWFVIAQKS
jgi:hypothetical protein